MPRAHRDAGFTLIELMTTISIVGVLATMATVSYDSARKYARDVRRISDMQAIQTAMELYFDSHLTYPTDGFAGSSGIVLGAGQALTLSDAGFGTTPRGRIYLTLIPSNPSPNGVPYVLRSLNADGTDCDKPPCATYEVAFALEGELAGLAPGLHVLSDKGVEREAVAGQVLPNVSGSFGTITVGAIDRTAAQVAAGANAFFNNPTVETGASAVVAPAATAGILGVVATAAPLAQIPRYFLFFFSQPFLYFSRRKRSSFGVVYDAFSKLPVDLAIVRLRDTRTGAILRSLVTDVQGRFFFIVHEGTYRIEVTKPGYAFPSVAMRGEREDGAFLDLYHGETVKVGGEGASLTPNVPLDPSGEDVPDATILRRSLSGRFRHAVALSGPGFALFSFIAVPTLTMGGLFVFHLGLYAAFRKLSIPHRPKNWGIVYEEGTDRPVPHSILRMFALPYHKLIATAVADPKGRYNFLVGPAEFYITISKEGFVKTETEPVDLKGEKGTIVIATDLPLRRVVGDVIAADVTVVAAGPAQQPGAGRADTPDQAISRTDDA